MAMGKLSLRIQLLPYHVTSEMPYLVQRNKNVMIGSPAFSLILNHCFNYDKHKLNQNTHAWSSSMQNYISYSTENLPQQYYKVYQSL